MPASNEKPGDAKRDSGDERPSAKPDTKPVAVVAETTPAGSAAERINRSDPAAAQSNEYLDVALPPADDRKIKLESGEAIVAEADGFVGGEAVTFTVTNFGRKYARTKAGLRLLTGAPAPNGLRVEGSLSGAVPERSTAPGALR